jgi:acyl-CoA thioester hydrolase
MFREKQQLRVRYADTDQMGYVYYGKYAEYFEVGRVEAMRALGFRYRDLETSSGIILPVASLNIRYRKPALYDDLLTVDTAISELPTRLITFESAVYNEAGELLTEGTVKLVFVDKKTNASVMAPKALMDKLTPYFE